MPDVPDLPFDCLATIISLTSPLDACRWSEVSPFFKSDDVWAKFLPADYQDLVPELLPAPSLKDLYLRLCDHPVLIEDGRKSFSLHKWSGKKCYMLAVRDLEITWGDEPQDWVFNSVQDSRFPECAELLDVFWFEIIGRISTGRLSSMTHYMAYLVFKLGAGVFGFQNIPIEATVRLAGDEGLQRTVFLHAEGEHVQNDCRCPIERGDGWLELELGKYFNKGGEDGELEMRIFILNGRWERSVIIEGIEIRPN